MTPRYSSPYDAFSIECEDDGNIVVKFRYYSYQQKKMNVSSSTIDPQLASRMISQLQDAIQRKQQMAKEKPSELGDFLSEEG